MNDNQATAAEGIPVPFIETVRKKLIHLFNKHLNDDAYVNHRRLYEWIAELQNMVLTANTEDGGKQLLLALKEKANSVYHKDLEMPFFDFVAWPILEITVDALRHFEKTENNQVPPPKDTTAVVRLLPVEESKSFRQQLLEICESYMTGEVMEQHELLYSWMESLYWIVKNWCGNHSFDIDLFEFVMRYANIPYRHYGKERMCYMEEPVSKVMNLAEKALLSLKGMEFYCEGIPPESRPDIRSLNSIILNCGKFLNPYMYEQDQKLFELCYAIVGMAASHHGRSTKEIFEEISKYISFVKKLDEHVNKNTPYWKNLLEIEEEVKQGFMFCVKSE